MEISVYVATCSVSAKPKPMSCSSALVSSIFCCVDRLIAVSPAAVVRLTVRGIAESSVVAGYVPFFTFSTKSADQSVAADGVTETFLPPVITGSAAV